MDDHFHRQLCGHSRNQIIIAYHACISAFDFSGLAPVGFGNKTSFSQPRWEIGKGRGGRGIGGGTEGSRVQWMAAINRFNMQMKHNGDAHMQPDVLDYERACVRVFNCLFAQKRIH